MSWKRSSKRNLDLGKSPTPENIGPGSYSVDIGSSRLSTKIKGSNSDRTPYEIPIRHVPAPGDYDPQSVTSARCVSSSFKSRSSRDVFKTSDNPSPAEHSQITVWKKEKKRPQTSRVVRERPPSANFGQGVSSYKMGDDGRIVAIKEMKKGAEWIGPGSYSPKNVGSMKAHEMKESYRDTDFRVASNPGPGSYNLREEHGRSASHIYERRPETPSQAPKSGNLTHTQWKAAENQSSVFSSRSNRNVFNTRDDTPGPGDYTSPKQLKNKRSASAFGSRSDRFSDISNESPGPGSYNVSTGNWKPTKVGYGRRDNKKFDASTEVPGPGQYYDSNQWIKSERPSSAFRSGSIRNGNDTDNLPGPGEYSPSISKGRSVSIHSSRFQSHNNFLQIANADTPPPDAYSNMSPTITKTSKISSTDRFGNGGRSKTPGPGQYESGHQTLLKKSYHIDCISSMKSQI